MPSGRSRAPNHHSARPTARSEAGLKIFPSPPSPACDQPSRNRDPTRRHQRVDIEPRRLTSEFHRITAPRDEQPRARTRLLYLTGPRESGHARRQPRSILGLVNACHRHGFALATAQVHCCPYRPACPLQSISPRPPQHFRRTRSSALRDLEPAPARRVTPRKALDARDQRIRSRRPRLYLPPSRPSIRALYPGTTGHARTGTALEALGPQT